MTESNNLQRFLDAQQTDYTTALAEIKVGRKRSHWMWYIFPQVKGLGQSSTSQFYGIQDLEEAEAYLLHETLGARLIEISSELARLPENNANKIFSTPDDLKLKSCMTLFSSLKNANPVFDLVLDKFFDGAKDEKTLKLIHLPKADI